MRNPVVVRLFGVRVHVRCGRCNVFMPKVYQVIRIGSYDGLARFFGGEGLRRPSSAAACGTLGAAPGGPTAVGRGGAVVKRRCRVCTCSGRVWSAVSTGTSR